MRLQHLRISAFGPFADPVDLDFAALNDAGLFLLTGSNGAGKSSILDAVCFALYGAVPGERNAARRFRSDHARPDQAPTVELEAAFSSGTYRVVRTAAWERPKRRGTGTTTQQSTVSVSRRLGDQWQPVTGRLDEAGQLMTGLVGMNLTQFCQVVILPQGRFQAFLQSTATERQALLQQLFHTGRFQRVEGWLREHRLALRRASADHESAVGEVINRISEVAASPAPESDADALAWADGLRKKAEGALVVATQQQVDSTVEESQARVALEAGRDLAARIRRLCDARDEQESLLARAGSVEGMRLRLDAARRAGQVATLTPLVETRRAALEAAIAAHGAVGERLVTIFGTTPADLTAEAASLQAATRRFEVLVPRADEAQHLALEQAAIADATRATDARQDELGTSSVASEIAQLTSRQETVRAAQLALPEVRGAIEEHNALLHAHEQATTLAQARARAAAELAAATSRALDAKEAWLRIREARIEGMAAELAGGLAVGSDCPVCGSLDHPHPALPHSDAPDAEAERAALRDVDDANALQHAHDQQVRDLGAALQRARQTVGATSVDALRVALQDHESRARELAAAIDAGVGVASALSAALERQRAEAAETQALREQSAVLRTRRDLVASRIGLLERELSAALADTPYPDARTAYDETVARLAEVETARRAEDDLAVAGRAFAEASGARTTAALEAGFGSAAEAEEALLPASRVDAYARDVDQYAARVSAVEGLLADPALQDLEGVETPDVAILESDHRAAEEIRAAAAAEAETRRRCLVRLDTLVGELSSRHQQWEPVRRELEVATHLSAFCEGKAPDNRWQMQLSAYVVAWRLSQVADAANVRLAVMTSGRYSLEHTDLRAAGERRGGMTLLVRDDWTGVTREPITLSGGESFVVALALALGLADVITAEAGGAALQTLFVDEGFGMLDAASLDLVVDTLDALRESGRTVGVVSHVAEMRNRIPVQVQVDKPRDHGPSTVRVRA